MKNMGIGIKSWIVDKLWDTDSLEINFNKAENEEVIQALEKSLFKPDELANNGSLSFSVLVRRALAQYLGQRYWVKTPAVILRNILSIIALPFFTAFALFKGLFNRQEKDKTRKKIAAITEVSFYKYFLDDIFPEGYEAVSGRDMALKLKDIQFIINTIGTCPRYLLNPDLLLRSLVKISQYSYITLKYNPQVICNFAEGSFWSSIMTAYCRANGIKHVNIMHGVRFYSSYNAFAEFDEFYVWGEYHLEQFKSMNVSARDFIIRGNPIHREIRKIAALKQNQKARTLVIMLEYYLWRNREMLALIGDMLGKLNGDWNVVCRLYYDARKEQLKFISELKERFGREIIVERPENTSILDSIGKADLVVGFYTNALSDAWIAGKKCIKLHSANDNKLPLQEYHKSKNIRVFSRGADVADFLNSPLCNDTDEIALKNKFSAVH